MRKGELLKDGLPILQVSVNNFKTTPPEADHSVIASGEILVGPDEPLDKGDYTLIVIDHSGEKRSCKITITESTVTKDKRRALFRGTMINP